MAEKHTYEYIKQYIEIISKSGCKLLSTDYINSKAKLKIECNCGNEFETTFNHFLKGKHQCNKCGRKSQSKTQSHSTKEFKNQIYDKYKNEYTVLGEYISNKTKILIRHNCDKCNNHEWKVTPNNILNKPICPVCANLDKRMTDEQFNKLIFEKHGNEFIILEKYKNIRTKIKVVHNSQKCNYYTWYTTPSTLLNKGGCPRCNYINTSKRFRKTNEEFLQDLSLIMNLNEYDLLDEYKTCRTKIKIRHCSSKCNNYTWITTPEQLLKGQRCPICSGNIINDEQFKKQVYNQVGNEYEVLGEYIKENTKILMKHNKCNHEWYVTPQNFIHNKSRCPNCSTESRKGESKIMGLLNSNKIPFIKEYRISECKYKRALPFDFAIFYDKEQTKLKCLIEYDGQQHFEARTFGGISQERANDNLLYVQNNDNIKNTYCENKNIKLIRIPYWEFDNIENILSDIL